MFAKILGTKSVVYMIFEVWVKKIDEMTLKRKKKLFIFKLLIQKASKIPTFIHFRKAKKCVINLLP